MWFSLFKQRRRHRHLIEELVSVTRRRPSTVASSGRVLGLLMINTSLRFQGTGRSAAHVEYLELNRSFVVIAAVNLLWWVSQTNYIAL